LQHPSILEKHCRLVSSEDSTVLLERNPRALVLVCGRQMADESVELFTGDTIQFGFLQALFYFNSPKQSFSRQISSTEDLDSQRAQSPSCSETIGESSRKDLDALTMEELKIKETLSENVEKLFRTHDLMRSTEEKKEVQLQDTLSRLEMQRSLTSSDLESMQTAASQQVEQQEQRVSETMARLRARKKSLAVIRHRLDSGATEDDRDAELGERLGSASDSEGLHETVESKQAEVSELERLLEAEQAELDEARRRHAEALEQQQAALHAQTERAEEVRRRRRALEQYVERKTDDLFKKKNLTPPTRRRISGRQLEKVRSDNDIGLLPVVAPEADYPEEVGLAEIEQPNASRQASTKRKQLKTSKRAQAVTSRLYPGQPPSTEARRRLTSGGSAEGAASRLRSAQSAPHLELSQAADAAGATVEETTVSLRRGGSRRVQTKFTPEGRFLSGEIVSRTTGPAAAPVGPSSLSASAARLSGGSSLLSVPEESLEDLTAEAKTAAGGGYKFAPGDRRSLPVGALSAAADKTSTAVKRRSGGHLRERQSPSQRQQQHQKQKTKRQSTNIQPQVEMSRQPITLEVSPYRQVVLEQLTSHEAPPRHSVEFYYDLAGENPATKGADPASTAPAAAGPRPLPHPSSIYTEQSGPMPMTPRPAALMEDSLEGADISSAEEKREQREREKNAQAAASKAGEDGAEAAAESAAGNTSDEAEGSLDSLGSDSASVPSSGKVEVAKTGENLNEEELKEAKVATVATA
uniref:FHA domain-containing protein n=1 Tax=Macrostomum lignano TaxID=282301 RepID=A0A1I8HTB2_9PLAT